MLKQINFKLLLAAFCFLFSPCVEAQVKDKATIKKTTGNTVAPSVEKILGKQILLTNTAIFTNNRVLEGASGFLIKYNGTNFAVTARHLLGEAGGVEPEVKINELSKNLIYWGMNVRAADKNSRNTIKLSAAGLDFSQSAHDIVLLKIVSDNNEIESLTPNFTLPTKGEALFLIGCPYSETSCKQNSYPVKYSAFEKTEAALVCEIDSNVDLSGFSGAPLINAKGEVLGILVSGGSIAGKNFILATHIKEIQKIKF